MKASSISSIARWYKLTYKVPGDKEVRSVSKATRSPQKLLDTFLELNPKAEVQDLVDEYTGQSVLTK